MSFENEINKTNEYYLNNDLAVIHKKPTPIKIVKMSKDNKKIILAFFSKHSTTDYNGIYKGYYIDFEAKSTNSKTSFKIDNFQPCQLEHFKKVIKQEGIAFTLIEFNRLQECYLLLAKDMFDYLNCNDRKSVPLKYIREKGYKIKRGLNPPLNYLPIVDEIISYNRYK